MVVGFISKVGKNMARTTQINNAENNTDYIATTGVIYLFCLLVMVGNFVQNQNLHLITPTEKNTDPVKLKIYDSRELRSIRSTVNHNPELKLMPWSTLLRIRSLKLQKRRKRGTQVGVTKEATLPRNNVNNNSPNIKIKIQPMHPSKNKLNLYISTGNVRSIKNKVSTVDEYIQKENFDAVILTETWIKNSDYDKSWTDCCQLNSDKYLFSTGNCKNK